MDNKKLTSREVDNELRARYGTLILDLLNKQDEDVAFIGNGILNLPCVDVNGNDSAIEISIKVPKGERIPKDEGGGFSGYDYISAREDWEVTVKQNEEKKKDKEKKAKKKEDK